MENRIVEATIQKFPNIQVFDIMEIYRYRLSGFYMGLLSILIFIYLFIYMYLHWEGGIGGPWTYLTHSTLIYEASIVCRILWMSQKWNTEGLWLYLQSYPRDYKAWKKHRSKPYWHPSASLSFWKSGSEILNELPNSRREQEWDRIRW